MSPQKKFKIGVVGATGLVGRTFLEILEERKTPVESLCLFASDQSYGTKLKCQNQDWPVIRLTPGCFDGLDFVFFSSGEKISLEWAPQAVKAGAYAIDNSSAFRMNPENHLVIPEINGHLLDQLRRNRTPSIIANPNCSTIQLLMALKPLSDQFGLDRVQLATYQSVSGAGSPAVDELHSQRKNFTNGKAIAHSAFPHQILENCIPQIGSFQEDGYCTEEIKVREETRKILDLPRLPISCMVVRVPVSRSHAETVWVTLRQKTTRAEVVKTLGGFPGVVVQDDPQKSIYPLQSERSKQDAVGVGRIHQDWDDPMTWLMWIVGDNLKKGAALNGIQIAERIFDIQSVP